MRVYRVIKLGKRRKHALHTGAEPARTTIVVRHKIKHELEPLDPTKWLRKLWGGLF